MKLVSHGFKHGQIVKIKAKSLCRVIEEDENSIRFFVPKADIDLIFEEYAINGYIGKAENGMVLHFINDMIVNY